MIAITVPQNTVFVLAVMMMSGVAAGRSLGSVRVVVRAAAGSVGHRIVRQVAQRRGGCVEGQQPPADQIAKTAQHGHQLQPVVRLLSLIASRKGCQAGGRRGSG